MSRIATLSHAKAYRHIDQRHIASVCASRVRTTYAHGTCGRTGRAQAIKRDCRGADVTTLRRLAFIGNSLPRRCGIATFTTNLQQAISKSCADLETSIVAMTDHGHVFDYPSAVRLQVNDDRIEDYVDAAGFLNAGHFDVVSLQHEFGIFGGEAGGHIMALLSRLTMPAVTTLHTV